MAPGLTDPKSWGQAIAEIGTSATTILALLAILAYLAFKGVPAVIDLTLAINNSTQAAEKRQTAIERNQETIISNQSTIIGNEVSMTGEHKMLLKSNALMQGLERQTCINTAKSPYQADRCKELGGADGDVGDAEP